MWGEFICDIRGIIQWPLWLRDHINGLVQETPNSIALSMRRSIIYFYRNTFSQGFIYSVIWLQSGDMAFKNQWHTMTWYNLYLLKDEGMSHTWLFKYKGKHIWLTDKHVTFSVYCPHKGQVYTISKDVRGFHESVNVIRGPEVMGASAILQELIHHGWHGDYHAKYWKCTTM